MRFLSLQKQQFVKNTVSLLFDFGRIMDKAQQEIDDEIGIIPSEHENNGGTETGAGA